MVCVYIKYFITYRQAHNNNPHNNNNNNDEIPLNQIILHLIPNNNNNSLLSIMVVTDITAINVTTKTKTSRIPPTCKTHKLAMFLIIKSNPFLLSWAKHLPPQCPAKISQCQIAGLALLLFMVIFRNM